MTDNPNNRKDRVRKVSSKVIYYDNNTIQKLEFFDLETGECVGQFVIFGKLHDFD